MFFLFQVTVQNLRNRIIKCDLGMKSAWKIQFQDIISFISVCGSVRCSINSHLTHRSPVPLRHKIPEKLPHEYIWNVYIHTSIHARTRSNVYTPRVYRCCTSLLNVHDDFYTHISKSTYLYHVLLYQWRFVRSKCRVVEEHRPKGAGNRIGSPTDETGRRTTDKIIFSRS